MHLLFSIEQSMYREVFRSKIALVFDRCDFSRNQKEFRDVLQYFVNNLVILVRFLRFAILFLDSLVT